MAERASLFVSNPAGVDGPITAEDARLGLAAGYVGSGLVTARSGFRPSATAPGLVTATGTPNGFVHVAPFQRTHQSLRYAGVYIQTLDVTKDIDVLGPNPADPTNIRHDLVIIHQQDVAAGEADSLMRIRYIVGTPAASPSDPSLAAYPEFRKLARVRVAAGATTITSAMIDDLRADGDNVLHTVASGGLLPISGATQRAAIISPYDGLAIYRTDRDWVEIYDGTAWRVQGIATGTSTTDLTSAVTSPVTDQLATAADINMLCRWSGSAWIPAVPLGGTSAATRHEGQYVQLNNQPITSNSTTVVKFDGTARYTTNDVTVSGTGNITFTLNRIGLWRAVASGRYNAGGGSERSLEIVNTTDAVLIAGTNNTGASPATLNCGDEFRISATGKALQVQTYQNSGGSIDLIATYVRLSLTWIRP